MCAAGSPERLAELKRASVGSAWELVGGPASAEDVGPAIAEWRPDVLVVDAALGSDTVTVARAVKPNLRVVAVGSLPSADAEATLDAVREAILGLPRPGGPVRRSRVNPR
jgi:hypothetical protein